MISSDSDDEDFLTPPQLKETAKLLIDNLSPQKSIKKCSINHYVSLEKVRFPISGVLKPSPTARASNDTLEVIQLEESCVMQGGICVRADDCDSDNTPLLGSELCPKQRHLGVTCCYI